MYDINRIKRLRQLKHDLKAQADGVISLAEREGGRPFTTSERIQLDRIKAELARNESDIIAAEEELDRERTAPAVRTSGGGVIEAPAQGKIGAKYADLFGVPGDNGGFKSFRDFAAAFHHSGLQFDPRLVAAQREGDPASGGFQVPAEYASQILDKSLENEIVRRRARIWPMKSDTLRIPGLDNTDHSSNLFGGFSASWVAELSGPSAQDSKSRRIDLQAKKMFLLGQSSNELVADMAYDAVYGAAMQAAVGWYLDSAFLTGTGAGMPLGILNDAALVTVAKESGQAANTILYENVVAIFARLHPACLSNSIWLANPSTIPQLLKMQIVVKNVAGSENVGGSAVPVISQDANGQFTLLTRPMIFTEKVPALSSAGDLTLVDLSQYYIGMRADVSLERSAHAGFLTDSTYFRVIVRCDGQGSWKGPMVPKNGTSNTLSWVVTLGAR